LNLRSKGQGLQVTDCWKRFRRELYYSLDKLKLEDCLDSFWFVSALLSFVFLIAVTLLIKNFLLQYESENVYEITRS